ncbi:GNAT family N-acetyltransferase [Zeimonas arvi]|uniref:GNAT family N-acetyltransferase n=1 Tax=Zeimonas arvi TaxID=2498847 RepID=A0A5C8NXR9_9BURK|nr:GNAT family N-acetyltransferase [Zeimonas arvi]TXL65976.1 GNAT family N-acetyltransferase [Zeimonas arvi]
MLVLPLTGRHDRSRFDCGRQELNAWLRQVASQHQVKGLSKSFVAVLPDDPSRICGFYALTLAELENRHLPESWRKRLPRRIPGVRLGRLAVDREFQGRRLGELLLLNALDRSRRIHREAGGAALFVDALDEGAADWYRRFGFAAAPENPLLLFLPVATIGELLS